MQLANKQACINKCREVCGFVDITQSCFHRAIARANSHFNARFSDLVRVIRFEVVFSYVFSCIFFRFVQRLRHALPLSFDVWTIVKGRWILQCRMHFATSRPIAPRSSRENKAIEWSRQCNCLLQGYQIRWQKTAILWTHIRKVYILLILCVLPNKYFN